MTPRLRTLLFLCLVTLGLAACNRKQPDTPGKTNSAETSHLAQIKQRGKLIVAQEVGYLPFEMKTSSGKLIGYDVELARLLAQELGVAVEFKNVAWDGIIPTLRTGKVDCIISGMSIDAKRQKVVDFTTPYYHTGQSVLINSKDKDKYKSYKDLNQKGLTITVQAGTTGEKAVRRLMPLARTKPLDKAVEAAIEVQQGRAAAMVFDQPFIAIYAMRNKKTTVALLEPFTEEGLGIAVRKTSPKLLAALNAALDALKQNGSLAKLEQTYFVDMPWLSDVPGK